MPPPPRLLLPLLLQTQLLRLPLLHQFRLDLRRPDHVNIHNMNLTSTSKIQDSQKLGSVRFKRGLVPRTYPFWAPLATPVYCEADDR